MLGSDLSLPTYMTSEKFITPPPTQPTLGPPTWSSGSPHACPGMCKGPGFTPAPWALTFTAMLGVISFLKNEISSFLIYLRVWGHIWWCSGLTPDFLVRCLEDLMG